MAKRACKIDGCSRPSRARGWCNTHYEYSRRHGLISVSPSTPQGEVQRYYREVVVPYEGDECLIWPYNRIGKGYASLGRGRDCYVHRRLCKEVHGPAPTPAHEAAHSCGRGTSGCVTKRHLSWKTPVENEADKRFHGTDSRGERNGAAKLTEADVRAIRAASGTQTSIGERFGVEQTTVSGIKRHASWAWLEM